MKIITILVTIILIATILATIYVYLYNRLQDYKLKIDEAENVIDECLRNKYDLILKIRESFKNNIKNNKINFKGLDELKNKTMANYEMDHELKNYSDLIDKVINDYPDIYKKADFRTLMNEYKSNDEKLTASKKFYNSYIKESNALVRKYPSKIVAKLNNISIKNFFDGKDMNDDDIEDFRL